MKPIIAAALILSASAAHAETKTVSWFLEHPEVRAKVIALCRDNPGEAQHTPSCINAFEAGEKASIHRTLREIDAARRPTMLETCDRQSALFQAVYHCGTKK